MCVYVGPWICALDKVARSGRLAVGSLVYYLTACALPSSQIGAGIFPRAQYTPAARHVLSVVAWEFST